jgi:phosphoenolpyruvate-protein kinase (PTS system EI component)
MLQSVADQILVSRNLFLSEVMKARNAAARGLVTTSQALTSHAAILLKGFNIPSLGAVEGLEQAVRPGDELILDALKGRLVVRPSRKTMKAYLAARREPRGSQPRPESAAAETRTKDGSRVTLLANIDNADQVELLLQNRLEGIGLFRTEFLLLGADKRLPYLDRCLAQNPSLGIRGIRRQPQQRGGLGARKRRPAPADGLPLVEHLPGHGAVDPGRGGVHAPVTRRLVSDPTGKWLQ